MGQILQFLGFLCWLSGDCLLCLSVIICFANVSQYDHKK